MKGHLLFLFGLIISISVLADVPQGISHQAVMRDAENNLIVESPIGLQVSILQGAHDGDAVYVETHNVTTNANGLVTYIIGEGDVVEGVFEEIDWGAGLYFLKTEADPMGGTDYTITGVTQFHSVPYAKHSVSAEVAETLKDGLHPGEITYWDGENWVPVAPGYHNETLRLCNGVPTWGVCRYDLVLLIEPMEGGSVTGAGKYEEGSEVLITATSNEGWEFVNWTGAIQYIDDNGSNNATVTMPAQDVSITANFKEEESDIIYGDGVTDIDDNDYVSVIIGDQEWMAENLRVTRYNNGDDIPTGLSNDDWLVNTEGAFAIYPHGDIEGLNSDEEVVAAYGKLYDWYAVDDARGLCPEGWSVPSDDDWTQLIDYLVDQGFPNSSVVNGAGNALKSCRQVGSPLGGECNTSTHPRWNSHGTHFGFDEFGFSALPGGYRWSHGNFYNDGFGGYWWSATELSGASAWNRGMDSFYGYVDRSSYTKRNGFSVRCFRSIE